MKVSDERLAEYNGRMNDWISKQGLIFQLTHGSAGLGGKPPIVGSLIRFTISILLLALISAIAYGGFLFWKVTGDDLPKQLQKGIAGGLGAPEVTANGFKRDLNFGKYKQIIAEGNEETFYNHIEARGIQFPMTPTSGLVGEWNAQAIQISELKIALKAGEADDEKAQNSWEAFFFESPTFTFSKLDVAKVSLSWGYSTPATWGSIIDSSMIAQRSPEGWELEFKGGTFSQGILRDFDIETLSVELKKTGGFQVTEAKLSYGEGTFLWSGKMVSGGAQPAFEFEGQLTGIPISAFLPRGLLAFVNGTISGELSASGSTNDSEGICYQISGQPHEGDAIVLTKELVLFRMLSHLDPQRSYRKVPFNQGSFKIDTKGEILNFSEIDLTSEDTDTSEIMTRLRGNLTARPTTTEELKEESFSLDEETSNTSQTIGAGGLDTGMSIEDQTLFADSILRKYRSLQFDSPPQELYYFTKDSKGEALKKNTIDLNPRRRFRSPFVLQGEVELAVPQSAFQNTPPLPGLLPREDDANLQWIQIDLNDLIQVSTKRLSDQWEEAMEEATEEE